MMKIFNSKFLLPVIVALTLVSCYSGQDVAPIDSPDDNAVITITPRGDYSSITEGDVLYYDITTSKKIKQDLDFSVVLGDAAVAVSESDFEVIGGTLEAYSDSALLMISVIADDFPELEENFDFEISSAEDIAYNFQVNPSSDVEVSNVAIANVNDDAALTVAMEWEDPSHYGTDFDMVVESVEYGSWSVDGATGSNPEIDVTIRTDYGDSYDGTYYVGIDPYDVPEGDINFTFYLGYADGTIEEFSGVFNIDMVENYPTTYFTSWEADVYHILTIVKSGDSFTVSYVF